MEIGRYIGRPATWKLLSAGLFFAAWEWSGQKPISLAFPPFSSTLEALIRLILDGTLLASYARTLLPLLVGLLISGLLGIGCGMAMGLSRRFEWLTLPPFIIVQTAPIAALIPVISFLYGIGFEAKVLAVILMATPIIVLNAYKGVRNANPSLIEMSRSFLGTRYQEIAKVVIPSASGLIFAGLRLGVAAGFTGIVLAELLISPTGIGDLITHYRAIADYPAMFAAIVSIIAVAALSISLLQRLEQIILRPEQRSN